MGFSCDRGLWTSIQHHISKGIDAWPVGTGSCLGWNVRYWPFLTISCRGLEFVEPCLRSLWNTPLLSSCIYRISFISSLLYRCLCSSLCCIYRPAHLYVAQTNTPAVQRRSLNCLRVVFIYTRPLTRLATEYRTVLTSESSGKREKYRDSRHSSE